MAEITAEPEAETETEPEASFGEPESSAGQAEPEPNWSTAFEEWGAAWHLHVYTFAAIFLVLALITLFSMCFYLKDRRRLKQGILTFSLQCLLLLFTVCRFLVMFINPYHTTTHVEQEPFTILWSFGQPGLTASFSVLLLAILDTTKLTLGPPRFQSLSVILGFTACHFAIELTSLVVVMVCSSCIFMLLICQILFILYGALLGIGYLYSGVVIYNNSKAGHGNDADNRKVFRLIKIAGLSSFVAFSITITYIYSASSEFGLYSDVTFVDAWGWWILQTIIRLEEVVSCCLVLMVAFRNTLGSTHKVTIWITKLTNRGTVSNQLSDSGYQQRSTLDSSIVCTVGQS